MPTPLEEIAPVPKAPHPPDIEDVLGPPPRAPRIGRHGALSGPIGSGRHGRGGRAARPPSPPHLAKPSPPPGQAQAASQPVRQTIIQEVKPAPYKPPVATPQTTPPDNQGYNPPRGMGNRRRTAAASARRNAADWRTRAGQPPAEGQGEGMSPEVKAKRAEQYAAMKGTLDALRQPPAQPGPGGEATS